jgi:hypothetical protein
MPIVTCKRDSGASCAIVSIPERARTNNRWPFWYDAQKREWPQKAFAEAPVAYWVFIDSQPQKEVLGKSWSLMAPSLQRLVQRHFEGLFGRKPRTFEEMLGWYSLVSSGSLNCKGITDAFLATDEWKKRLATQTDEQIVRSIYQGLLGIDADAAGLKSALAARKKGEPWANVSNDLMRTELYRSICSREWY